MPLRKTLIVLAVSLITSSVAAFHCERPAPRWEDASLSGNGLHGVMQFGDPRDDRFIFNNHRLLLPNGAPVPIPDMADAMHEMQDRMVAGEIGPAWADYYAELRKRGNLPPMIWTQGYHPSHVLRVKVPGAGEVRDYRRETDYATGEIVVTWTDDLGAWRRRTFVSRADDVVVTELTPPAGAQTFDCELTAEPAERHRKDVKDAVIVREGILRDSAIEFIGTYSHKKDGIRAAYLGRTRVVRDGGTEERVSDGVQIAGAKRVLLLTGIARYRDSRMLPKSRLRNRLNVIKADYTKLLARHVAIHRPIYERVTFQLATAEGARDASNEELLARVAEKDPAATAALLERLVATSRYLFLCSAGDEYAPRLSGVFLGKWGAAWAGDYTCDANVNLAVLGGAINDLPECQEGYFAILERTMPQWRDAAQKLYGCRGILGPIRIDGEVAVHHHVNRYHAHLTATGLGPWLLWPMWDHYLVTGDKEFLRERLHPLLREQAQFYEDFLTRTDEDGKYIFVPSNSPENSPANNDPRTSASINSTMDIAAFKHCLTMLAGSEKALGIEPDADSMRWRAMLSKAPPYQVTEEGFFREWNWPSITPHYDHRHSSHIYPVFPGGEVTVDNPTTAELATAMGKSLDKRRRKHIRQAHDLLQKAIAWIYLKRADRWGNLLDYFLSAGYVYDSLATSHNAGLDIYNYDSILCLGGLVTESIVFTDPETIELLPALPEQMPVGELRGVLGRCGARFERIAWDTTTRTIEVRLTSRTDQTVTLRVRAGIESCEGPDGVVGDGEGATRLLSLPAGEEVELRIAF